MQEMDHTSQEQSNSCRKKRHLSDTDPDSCEFTPLFKRINNLHLNGTNLNSSENHTYQSGPVLCECRHQPSTSNSVVQCSLCNPNLYGITRQALPLPDLVNIPHEMAMANHHKDGHQQQDHSYSPDMDFSSNPHYYTPNKLLFDLHIERVKRQTFKPNDG